MLSLSTIYCNTVRTVDRTARHLLNLGRSTGTVKPYIKKLRLGTETIILDKEFFTRFLKFCSVDEQDTLTDMELLLFRAILSTETNIYISEEERQLVFSELSRNIILLVDNLDSEEKDIVQEYRGNSEFNKTKDGTC